MKINCIQITLLVVIATSYSSAIISEEFKCFYILDKCNNDSCVKIANDTLLISIKTRIKQLSRFDSLKNCDTINDTIIMYKEYYLVRVHGKSYLEDKCTEQYIDSCHKEINRDKNVFIDPDPCFHIDCVGWILFNKSLKLIDASYGISEKTVMTDVRKKNHEKRIFISKLFSVLIIAIPMAIIIILFRSNLIP